jgi:hypothetical protein
MREHARFPRHRPGAAGGQERAKHDRAGFCKILTLDIEIRSPAATFAE